MRSILDKRAQIQVNMVLAWILAIALIMVVLSFILFPNVIKNIIQNILPKTETTTDKGFDVISGEDKNVWGNHPEIPTDIKQVPTNASCSFFTEVYKGTHIIYNGSGYPIGYFLPTSRSDKNALWGLFNNSHELVQLFNTGYMGLDLNKINAGNPTQSGLALFNGNIITCVSEEGVIKAQTEGQDKGEYYVSNEGCYGVFSNKYCIKYNESGKEIKTDFYFETSSFVSDKDYILFQHKRNWLQSDREVCKIQLWKLIDGDCDLEIGRYSEVPRIKGTKLMLSVDKTKYIFNKTTVINGNIIAGASEEGVIKAQTEGQNKREYYVSNEGCYGVFSNKYCIKYNESGNEIKTDFYFKHSSFFLNTDYVLFQHKRNWLQSDREVCKIQLWKLIDGDCDYGISLYSDVPRIKWTKLTLSGDRTKYIFNKTIVIS